MAESIAEHKDFHRHLQSLLQHPDKKANSLYRQRRKIVSAESGSLIFPISKIPSKSQQYKLVAALTRTHSSSIQTIRTMFTSTSLELLSSVKVKSSQDVQVKRLTRIQTQRCFALM